MEEFLSCQGFWGLEVKIYLVRGWRFRPMRIKIAAEMNHSRAFRGRTETKQKSFHLRDVQHELQLGHWRMVCIWKKICFDLLLVVQVRHGGGLQRVLARQLLPGHQRWWCRLCLTWFIFWWDLVTGGCPVMTKRGSMEKLRALAAKTDRSASGSGYSAFGSGYSASGSGYTFGSGSD